MLDSDSPGTGILAGLGEPGMFQMEFERLTAMAVSLSGAAHAQLVLLEGELIWLVARACASPGGSFAERPIGDDASDEFSRHDAPSHQALHGFLCRQVVRAGEPLIVADTASDIRFPDMPGAAAAAIRSYAGFPLRMKESRIVGVLCVFDMRPFILDRQAEKHIADLAALVGNLLGRQSEEVMARGVRETADRRAGEAEIRARFLHQIERMAAIGAWRADLTSGVVDWSPEVYGIYDLPMEGTPSLDKALSCYLPEDREMIREKIRKCLEVGEGFSFEVDFISATGRHKRVRALGEREMENGDPVAVVGVFQDISDQHLAQKAIWRAAHIDELSGLPNRQWFQKRLKATIERAQTDSRRIALLMIDLDAFKELNDTLGHQVGDEVIRQVARRLDAAVDETVATGRLGGDEFAAMITDAGDEEQIRASAKALLAALHEPLQFGGREIYVTASIGVALFPVHATSLDGLIRSADIALYKVKRTGRGRIAFFSPEIRQIFDQRRTAIELVRRAATDSRILPYYQPVQRLSDGRLLGYEALARIRREDGTIVGPSEFAGAFADAECARQIDMAMLEAITHQIVTWRDAGVQAPPIAFNVSDYFFHSETFLQSLSRRFEELDVAPSMLKLEVTESVLLGDGTNEVQSILSSLREWGMKISLDDFGTGYASLTHLLNFPVDEIKIDKSFVDGLGKTNNSRLIVSALIDLATKLDIDIIAEGVETRTQVEELMAAGCPAGQGYLFGRPAPASMVVTTPVSLPE